MKRKFRYTALTCGLACALIAANLSAQGAPGGKKPAQDRGNGPKENRGGGPKENRGNGPKENPVNGPKQDRGNGSQGDQGDRGPPRVAPGTGQGRSNVPPVAAPRQAPAIDFRQPSTNRTPSFSRPNTPDRQGITSGRSGSINGAGVSPRREGSDRAGIRNQPFAGNTVQFNDRRFNVGNNSYRPAYYRHSGYHGYWNGNRGNGSGVSIGQGGIGISLGGYGWGLGAGNGYNYGNAFGNRNGGYGSYGNRPFGWGLGGWGLGSLNYNSGYLGYANPYYVQVGSNGYNYSQPIPVAYNGEYALNESDPNSPESVMINAVAAFQQNDYDAALDITNKGIARYPDDSVLHEFRALVLFARQDFQQSASTIHSVLAVGPGWDWTTLSQLYSNVAIYTEQLRTLESFTKTNPQDAASRFLLAYHYLCCGHPDAAARHLQQVVKLMPEDRVAAEVLQMISHPQSTPSVASPQPVQSKARPSINPATLVGTWAAVRADGSRFNLNLTNDSQFLWSFIPEGQKPQEFGGTYTVEGNVLALDR